MSRRGRPPRDLPPEIGTMPDDCAAYLLAERGESPTTRQGVAYLRRRAGIPAFGTDYDAEVEAAIESWPLEMPPG